MANFLQRVAMAGSGARLAVSPPVTPPPVAPGVTFHAPRLSPVAPVLPVPGHAEEPPLRHAAPALPPVTLEPPRPFDGAIRNAAPRPEPVPLGPPRQQPQLAPEVVPVAAATSVSPSPVESSAPQPPARTNAGIPAPAHPPPAQAIHASPPATKQHPRIQLPGLPPSRAISLPRTLRPLEAPQVPTPVAAQPVAPPPAPVLETPVPPAPASPVATTGREPAGPPPAPGPVRPAPAQPFPARIVPAASPSPAQAVAPPAAHQQKVTRIEIGQVDVQVFPISPVAPPQRPHSASPPRTDPLEARFLNRFQFRL